MKRSVVLVLSWALIGLGSAAAADKAEVVSYLEHRVNGRIDRQLPAPEIFGEWLRDNSADGKVRWSVNHCGQRDGQLIVHDNGMTAQADRPVCGAFEVALPSHDSFACWVQVGIEGKPISDSYVKVVRCFIESANGKRRNAKISELPDYAHGEKK